MQSFITLISIVAFASNVFAGRQWDSARGTAAISSWAARPTGDSAWSSKCLTEAKASVIVAGYTYLLEKPTGPEFNSTADSLLTEDFVVWSDSIQFLGNRPLNTPSFTSKEEFIASQARTPPIPTVKTDEFFNTCEKIVWRWTGSGIGTQKMDSKGIITMNITNGQIAAVYSEFNTGAWLVDFKEFPCNSTS